MNKFIISLCAAQLFICSSFASAELTDAVETEQQESVKSLLANYELNKKQKDDLLGIAQDNVKMRNGKLGLFSSPRDLMRLLFGTWVTGFGLGTFGVGLSAAVGSTVVPPNVVEKKIVCAGGVVIAVIGCFITRAGINRIQSGWTLKTARANLKNAREIVELINEKPATK